METKLYLALLPYSIDHSYAHKMSSVCLEIFCEAIHRIWLMFVYTKYATCAHRAHIRTEGLNSLRELVWFCLDFYHTILIILFPFSLCANLLTLFWFDFAHFYMNAIPRIVLVLNWKHLQIRSIHYQFVFGN